VPPFAKAAFQTGYAYGANGVEGETALLVLPGLKVYPSLVEVPILEILDEDILDVEDVEDILGNAETVVVESLGRLGHDEVTRNGVPHPRTSQEGRHEVVTRVAAIPRAVRLYVPGHGRPTPIPATPKPRATRKTVSRAQSVSIALLFTVGAMGGFAAAGMVLHSQPGAHVIEATLLQPAPARAEALPARLDVPAAPVTLGTRASPVAPPPASVHHHSGASQQGAAPAAGHTPRHVTTKSTPSPTMLATSLLEEAPPFVASPPSRGVAEAQLQAALP
jgi:hypothetical protein